MRKAWSGGFSQESTDRIVLLRQLGFGYEQIGLRLEREGYATPRGGRWWPATVRRALNNAVELGDARAVAAAEVRTGRRLLGYAGRRSTAAETRVMIEWMRDELALSEHEIADFLTEGEVPTTRGGSRWWQSTVHSVLMSGRGDEVSPAMASHRG